MTSLAGVLAGAEAPGVEQVSGSSEAVAADVIAAGWRVVRLDTSGVSGKQEVLRAFGPAFAFPDWYGANLDALADCLRDVTDPTVLVWVGSADLDDATHGAVVEVLTSRTTAPPAFHVVLL